MLTTEEERTVKHARIIDKKVKLDSIGYMNSESDPFQWRVWEPRRVRPMLQSRGFSAPKALLQKPLEASFSSTHPIERTLIIRASSIYTFHGKWAQCCRQAQKCHSRHKGFLAFDFFYEEEQPEVPHNQIKIPTFSQFFCTNLASPYRAVISGLATSRNWVPSSYCAAQIGFSCALLWFRAVGGVRFATGSENQTD
jgi:hypothetical protein